MTELLTAAQMRAIEAAAIASGEVTGLELMERAGRGVVEAIFEEWPELAKTSHRAVVLCGPGGNGGDGFVVARLLKEWGWEVEVFLYGDPERMPPDARVNYERWLGMGEVTGMLHRAPILKQIPDVVVDAFFGIGLTRQVDDNLSNILLGLVPTGDPDMDLPSPPKTVSVDMPSGMCSDSGRPLGEIGGADLTVTFHASKLGHYLGESLFRVGKLVVRDIGLRNKFVSTPQLVKQPLYKEASSRDRPLEKYVGHKYTHGHALILSGPPGHGGAARLAARGALRIGAGLVTVACPPDAIPENAARLDAIMLRAVVDGAGLAEVLADKRINALCLGPGLGLDARAVGLVAAALGCPPPLSPPHAGEGTRHSISAADGNHGADPASPLPQGGEGSGLGGLPKRAIEKDLRSVVLDADALTILAHHPDLFAALQPACILTPHAGEFARLFPDVAEKLAAPATKGPAYSKVDATREAAKRAGCVVLYKGPDTVIADPAGRCSINSAHYYRAAPWLATAGSGDVLAGFITGLLARGFQPMQAAETAAWLHVECARSFGPGLIAEDLAEELPKVFRGLGL